MKTVLKILLTIASIAYPIVVFVLIFVLKLSPRVLVYNLLAIGVLYFFANSADAKADGVARVRFWGMVILVLGLSALVFITENFGLAKLYPVFINAFLIVTFGYTLIRPPTMIFRIAQMQDKSIADSPDREYIEQYTKKVTQVWCVFFIFNGITALITSFWTSDAVWAAYNGLVSYILIGLIFLVEFIIRKRIMKK